MTVAIYARLSTTDAGDSLSAQVDLCRAWLSTQGVTDEPTVYAEDAQSAYKKSMTARPEWARLEKDIRQGKITRVVARHMDRLTRSVKDLLHLVDLVKETGVRLDTVWSGDLDLNTAMGQQIATITAAISQGESATKSERIRASKARVRAKGKVSGGRIPFGWESVNGALNAPESDLIREAIHYVIDGGSLIGATRMFQDSGLLPHYGKSWQPTNVKYVLMRWRNAGHLSHNGEDAGPSKTFPAIVSLDDLRTARAILQVGRSQRKNLTVVRSGPYPTTLLSGLAMCSRCNQPFKGGGRANERGKPVYRCRSCNSSVSRELLDELAAHAMVRFWSRVDVADVAPTEELKAEIVSLRAQLATLEEERTATLALRKDGLVSMTELRDLLTTINTRQEAVNKAMLDVQERFALASTLQVEGNRFTSAASQLQRWKDTPLDLQRTQLAEVWSIVIRSPEAAKASTVVVNGKPYREHVTKARGAQRRALFTCRLAPALSFDPVEEDRNELIETVADSTTL